VFVFVFVFIFNIGYNPLRQKIQEQNNKFIFLPLYFLFLGIGLTTKIKATENMIGQHTIQIK